MKAERPYEATRYPVLVSQGFGCLGGLFPRLLVVVLAGVLLAAIHTRADDVYVWGYGGVLQKLSTNGLASVVTTNLSGYNGPIGLVCDNVGNVYAGDPGTSTIWRFSSDGNTLNVGFVDSVSGLAFDNAGILYATSPNWNVVFLPTWGPPPPWGAGRYNDPDPPDGKEVAVGAYPLTLAIDTANNVYVADNTNASPYPLAPVFDFNNNNTIHKFVYGSSLTNLGIAASGLNCPWGMAFGSDGSLYVANSGTNGDLSNTILKFSTNGTRSVFATATNGLSGPRGLAFDSAGNLYVANSLTGSILKFTPDGTGSVIASGLNSPTSIAIYPGLKVWSATPIKLNKPTILATGALQFDFTENPGLSFTVLASTNASSSIAGWSTVGSATEPATGQYQFTDTQATNYPQRLYRVRSP
jgi:sugar lactone lactonase YvrE